MLPATLATPAVHATSTVSMNFTSGYTDGADVPDFGLTAGGPNLMWGGWPTAEWKIHKDSTNSNWIASPNPDSGHGDISGTGYILIEDPAYRAGLDSSHGYFVDDLLLANIGSADQTFTFGCGNQTPWTGTVTAHSTMSYTGFFGSTACNGPGRPDGYLYLMPATDDGTLGIENMTLDYTDSGNILGTAYTNVPQATSLDQNYATFSPFIAQASTNVNAFEFFIGNYTTGTDTKATYKFGLYDSSAGKPNNLLLSCIYKDFPYTTSPSWTECDSAESPNSGYASLTAGSQYFLAIVDMTSHSGTYHTYLYDEDWFGNVNNTNESSSAVSDLTNSPSLNTSYPDLGRHPLFFAFWDIPTYLIGNDGGGATSLTTITNGPYNVNFHMGDAQQFVAQDTNTVTHLWAYYEPNIWGGASQYGAAAIWSDSSGQMGSQLGSCYLTSGSTFGWTSCAITGVPVTIGTKYWLAAYNPATGGNNAQYAACANYDSGSGCTNVFGGAGTEHNQSAPGYSPFWGGLGQPNSTNNNLLVYATT